MSSSLMTSKGLLFQLFHQVVDTLQLFRNLNALRTVAYTFTATDAVIGLTYGRQGTVVAYKEGTTGTPVIGRLTTLRDVAFVDALVVVE